MKKMTRLSGLLSLGALLLLTACGPSTSTTTSQTTVPPQTSAPLADNSGFGPSLPPQVVELGCPVQSAPEMVSILRGYYGVDGMRRPLNSHNVPVDPDGNCLSTAPVPEVFSAAVAPIYIDVLRVRYHYSYYYQPGYVHVIILPGTVYRRNVVPSGRVIVQTVRPAGTTVTVPAGTSNTVRPGAPVPTTTVAPGASSTVRPGAPAAAPSTNVIPGQPIKTVTPVAPVATPSAVTPPKVAAPTSTFNRPTAAPAAAPTAVTPPRAAAPTSMFNRPTSTPSSVTPPRAAAPTSTFSRPRR